MHVMMVPLHEDGTRNESLQTVTVPGEQLRGIDFPAASDVEQEATRLQLFRDAQRLFEQRSDLLERMQSLIKAAQGEKPPYVPKPQTRRDLHQILIELHERLFPADQMPPVLSIVAAPEDRTVSIYNGLDWTIWHLEPERPENRVYNNGQPFGHPLVELWHDEDFPRWDEKEGDSHAGQ